MIMGELNESSLYCYWILKFKPFFDVNKPDEELNLKFSLLIFFYTILHVAARRKKKVHVSTDMFNHIKYAFQYRELSKEAIMALAESLIDA
jgi:hypothetical protein